MTKSLSKRGEKFPAAGVPGAMSLDNVFDAWKKKGLKPIEVTAQDFVQRINIEHDTKNGQLKWKIEKMDGLQAIGVLFDAIVSISKELLFADLHPKLNSGKAKIALGLEDNKIIMACEPAHDPVVLKGLLVAGLLKICDLTNDKDFNPLTTLKELIEFKVI